MKYSEKLTWEAVGDILPSLLEAKEKDVELNLVSCLKLCAIECFIKNGTYPPFWTGYRNFAALVVKEALTEISTEGYITFGTIDDYSEI